jgi:hypothetical protein
MCKKVITKQTYNAQNLMGQAISSTQMCKKQGNTCFKYFFLVKILQTIRPPLPKIMIGLAGAIQEDTNMLASDHRTQNQMLLIPTLPFYT